MSTNKIFLIGRMGQDPETVSVGDTTVTKFSLATSDQYKDKSGEKKEITEWHRIEAWGKQGEVIAQYHTKGDLIHIEGKLIYDQWEKDGVKQTTAKIRVNGFDFIKARTDQPQTTPKPQPAPVDVNGQDSEDDDLPF